MTAGRLVGSEVLLAVNGASIIENKVSFKTMFVVLEAVIRAVMLAM